MCSLSSCLQVIHEPPPPVLEELSVSGFTLSSLFCTHIISLTVIDTLFVQHISTTISYGIRNTVSFFFRMTKMVSPRRGGLQWTPRTTEDVELEASREWRFGKRMATQIANK